MTCTPDCIQPSPSQAHCAVCHVTWSGIGGFDAHRDAGTCRTPDAIGYQANAWGVYSKPVSDAERNRLAALRDRDSNAPSAPRHRPQAAETGSGVLGYTPEDSGAADSRTGGEA